MSHHPFTMLPKQMGLPMSPAYSHTVSAASPDDDDDGDICPVCDGECTCNNTNLPLRPPSPPRTSQRPAGPLSMTELSPTSSSTPSFLVPKQPPSRPSLKIKLALPPSMLAKRGLSQDAHRKSRNQDETMFVDANAGDPFATGASTPTPSHPYASAPPPRKRGRPRKNAPVARGHSPDPSSSPIQRRNNPKTTIIGRQKQHIYAQKFAKTLKARPPASKKSKKKAPAPKRRPRADSISSLSDLTDDDDDDDDDFAGHSRAYDPDSEDDDTASVQFPTFVSASALSSMESGADGNSSDTSSLSDFSSDFSVKDEEENFIVSEMQGRRRDSNNEWVIKRRQSVGLSDAEVDMDSDATEDDEEDNEDAQRTIIAEPEEDDDGEETDGRQNRMRNGIRGLVTCWSDEESDTFDADVFFANLSSESDSTDDEAKESGGHLMDDDDETSSDVSTEELMHMREELENLPLELAESWDGQLMFTNGTLSGQAIIDIDFEVNASQFVAGTDPSACCKNGQCPSPTHDHHSMSHDGLDNDVEMSEVDDGGYEEDAGEGEGDTTDEELVGDDDLPNERAMRLFNFPLSVSAINPLSTVSPAVTPSSKRPGPRSFGVPSNRLQSPSPADILAGKHGWDSADEMDELYDSVQRGRRLGRGDGTRSEGESAGAVGPRKGVFVPVQEARQVVIDGTQKDIPSPHPRFNRRRPRRFNTVEALLRNHLLSIARNPSSFVPAATVVPNTSPLKLLPSVEIPAASTSAASGLLTPGSAPQQADDALPPPIDLDDVFESSFFNNPEPTDTSPSTAHRTNTSPTSASASAPPDSTADDESDLSKTKNENENENEEMKHLHRWDVISVGAFRQTRESSSSVSGILESPGAPGGWTSSGHRRTSGASAADYGNVLKTGPLSAMLWPTAEKKASSSSARRVGVGAASLGASPVMLPTSGDGDRTPTQQGSGGDKHHHHHRQQQQQQHQHQQQQQQQQNNYAPKTRKELRKEKKKSKKKALFGHSPHGHPVHQYHSHHHHPNGKGGRSGGSVQRVGGFGGVGVVPLGI